MLRRGTNKWLKPKYGAKMRSGSNEGCIGPYAVAKAASGLKRFESVEMVIG